MTNTQRTCRLLAALFGATFLSVPSLAHAEDTTPDTTPPAHEPVWYQNRAEITFAEWLAITQVGHDFSPGPYCSVSEDFQTANCQVEIDGVITNFVGTLYESDERYDNWTTPEHIAAMDAVDAASSPEEAFTINAEAEGHTLTDVECHVYDDHDGQWTDYLCHGATTGSPLSDRWAGLVSMDVGGDNYAYGDFVDDLLDGHGNGGVENTPLVQAAQDCIDVNNGNVYASDYDITDLGHAMTVTTGDAGECLTERLGLPEWPLDAIITTPLYFDGYGMVLAQGGDDPDLIIFDDTASPKH